MGGGEPASAVEESLPIEQAQHAETPSSPVFSREFTSTLWYKPTAHRKRAMLTPDDFLAHAFGPDFAVSLSRKDGDSAGSSRTPSGSGTATPGGSSSTFSSSSQDSRPKARHRKSISGGGVLPKIPPRGTFSSMRKASKPKDLTSPPPSIPASPVLPLTADLPPQTPPNSTCELKSIPPRTPYVQNNPRSEPFMTPEEWRESSERRIQRRQLRKLAFTVDLECTRDKLPLDIDCRPTGWSMGMGLAPKHEESFQRLGRGRRPGRNFLDDFWPACDTPEHTDDCRLSSCTLSSSLSATDIDDVVERCNSMSIASTPPPLPSEPLAR